MGGNNSKPDEETKTEEEPPAAAAMSPLGRRKSSYGAGLDVLGNEMWKSSRKLGPPPLCWIHVVDEATGLRSPDPYRVEDFADLESTLASVVERGERRLVLERGVEASWDEVKRVATVALKRVSTELDLRAVQCRFENTYEEHYAAQGFGAVGGFFGAVFGAVFGGLTCSDTSRWAASGYRKCARAYYRSFLAIAGLYDDTTFKLVKADDMTPRLQRVGEVQVKEETASVDLATAAVLPWSADPARGEGLLVKAKPLE